MIFPFRLIICDAYDFTIGAILGQRVNGMPHVIYFANKTLIDAQEIIQLLKKSC